MKKVLLSLGVLFSAGLMAQNAVHPSVPNGQPLTPAQQSVVAAAEARIHQSNNDNAKVAGGAISQYMSHSDIAEQLFSSQLTNYIAPIFQDSTVKDDFGTPDWVNNHAYGALFDVTSEAFSVGGVDYFSDADSYTVDSVLIGGFYERVNNKSTTHVGDTLVVDVVYGVPTNSAIFRQGLTWPAGTWSNQTVAQTVYPVIFAGSTAQGWAGDVAWTGKLTFKKALTPDDTLIGYHSFYTNLQVPAGQVLGVVTRFKSGESYSTGDIYFAGSGSTSTAVLNSFRVLTTGPSSSTDDAAYFFEEITMGATESFASAGPLFSDQRYGGATGFYTPQGASTTDWWIHVTGTSTVSLEENNALTEVKLYPNPTNGNVTLEVAQGGTYTVEVVNMVGQSVHSEIINVNGGEKINRDFSSLVKGIYLVNIKGEGSSNTMKLTIK